MKLAVSGKGGAGKTTLVSLLARRFRDMGKKVIAIDADPDANLAHNLGFPANASITPIIEMKELIRERVGAEPGMPTVFFAMNPRVHDIPERFAAHHDGIRLMVMGSMRRGGSGCACPEHIIVKELVRHLLVERDEVVLLDMAAGIEHLSRATAQHVDVLAVVVQPTAASIQTFHRIKAMASDLGINSVAMIANRVRSEGDIERIQRETAVAALCALPESPALADYRGGAIDDAIAQAVDRCAESLQRLC